MCPVTGPTSFSRVGRASVFAHGSSGRRMATPAAYAAQRGSGTMAEQFLPYSIRALKAYSTQTFIRDLLAGVTVGLVALPLAMAFAISSGTPPEVGIYTAIVTGFLISLLGGSAVQIGGPTGAFVVVVAGIIAQYGIDGLYMSTLMAGVVLVVMGLTG